MWGVGREAGAGECPLPGDRIVIEILIVDTDAAILLLSFTW